MNTMVDRRTVVLDGKVFFLDRALGQLRAVMDPNHRIHLTAGETLDLWLAAESGPVYVRSGAIHRLRRSLWFWPAMALLIVGVILAFTTRT